MNAKNPVPGKGRDSTRDTTLIPLGPSISLSLMRKSRSMPRQRHSATYVFIRGPDNGGHSVFAYAPCGVRLSFSGMI